MQSDSGKQRQVQLGRCNNKQCPKLLPSSGKSSCCGSVTHEHLDVLCDEFSYLITRTLQCGCVPCSSNANANVHVRGIVLLDNGSGLRPLSVNFLYLNQPISSKHNGTFELNVTDGEPTAILHFRKTRYVNFVPRVVILPSLSYYTGVHVVVLKSAPKVIIVNPRFVKVIPLQYYSMKMNISIPAGTLTVPSPNPVPSDVEVYVSVSDLSVKHIQQAPGRFLYVDDGGEIDMYLCYQVVTVISNHRAPVRISGRLLLTMSMKNVNSSLSLMRMEEASGMWEHEGGPLEPYGNPSDRLWHSYIYVTNAVTYISLGHRVPPQESCVVLVQLFASDSLVDPADTVDMIDVFVLSQNVSLALAHYAITTSTDGYVCVPVVCGMRHQLQVRQNELNTTYTVTNARDLPENMEFTSNENIFYFTATMSTDEHALRGPVFPRLMRMCDAQPEAVNIVKLGHASSWIPPQLFTMGPLYGGLMSWYSQSGATISPAVCVIKLTVEVYSF